MARPHELVLVGGGHAHVQVLRRWAMAPQPGVRTTLVVDRSEAVYSGMVPGFVAGRYAHSELAIDLRPLAIRAGARLVVTPAIGIDPEAGRLELAGRPALPYDTASFDVGSRVAGLQVPGVREHTLPTRPIGDFVRRVEEDLARPRPGLRAVVVGGGAAGVELAFALRARLPEPRVTLVESGPRVLAEAAAGVARRVEHDARAVGIELRTGSRVQAVAADAVQLEDGTTLPADLVLWVAGAAALGLFAGSGLPLDEGGFVRVRPTLQVVGHDALFAVGDCASLEGPPLPKAGVFAVRQGPVLAANLRARATGRTLRRYTPQRDFLALLNLGDGRALGTKWGLSAEGRGVMRLKDWIDRRFVDRFQVLAPDGTPRAAFPPMPGMEPDAPPCGGCAAKLGADALGRALARLGERPDADVLLGLGSRDDAAAMRLAGDAVLVASLDAFPAFTDDPFLVGRVAALNAANDLWAKGVAPRFALAQVQLADEDPAAAEETLFQLLAGARAAFDPEGVSLVGGHTTTGSRLQVGFAVHGSVASAATLLRRDGLRAGDALILSEPLGSGVLFHADMRGLARGPWIEAALASMLRPAGDAARIATEAGVSASTDVSGFGLAGHLGELLMASKASARLQLAAIPLFPGVAALLKRGLRSTLHAENARRRRLLCPAAGLEGRAELEALYDPQTAGGLLLGVSAAQAEALVDALRRAGHDRAVRIGTVTPPEPEAGRIEVVP